MTDLAKPHYKKSVAYQAALLSAFTTLAAALLVTGNLSTRAPIAQRQKDDVRASLNQVVPPGLHDNNLLDNPVTLSRESNNITIYRAMQGARITALAYEISGQGYGGKISLIMSVDHTGRILGVRVLSHAETPGLGDRIEAQKDDWILGFNGLSLGKPAAASWAVKKDGGRFDQFSGATITPRAVIKAVREGLQFFSSHRAELLAVDTATDAKTPAPSIGKH